MPKTNLVEKVVNYNDNNEELEGYFVYDKNLKEKSPLVLIVHEWFGITDFEKQKARDISKLGYVGFAIDIYGKNNRPTNVNEAAETANYFKENKSLMLSRTLAAINFIKKESIVDNSKIIAVGYCFGGTVVLNLAYSGENVSGVVSVHGGIILPGNSILGKIKSKILILHGGADPYSTVRNLYEFNELVKDSNIDYQIIIYGGAVHSFTNPVAGSNPKSGAAYNETSAKKSWEHTKLFLEEIFK